MFDYNDRGNEFFIIMDGEVEILVPVEETAVLLPKNNEYSEIMHGMFSKKSDSNHSFEWNPSENDYKIALLAHVIQNLERIAWVVYKNPEIKNVI